RWRGPSPGLRPPFGRRRSTRSTRAPRLMPRASAPPLKGEGLGYQCGDGNVCSGSGSPSLLGEGARGRGRWIATTIPTDVLSHLRADGDIVGEVAAHLAVDACGHWWRFDAGVVRPRGDAPLLDGDAACRLPAGRLRQHLPLRLRAAEREEDRDARSEHAERRPIRALGIDAIADPCTPE